MKVGIGSKLAKSLNISEIRISSSMSFLISFDIPREMNSLRLRVFRRLKVNEAKMIHESLWESKELEELVDLALLIKKFGGSARILEEKFIF